MEDEQKQNVDGLENVQWNVVIRVPKMGLSLEVQLPATSEGGREVYSISSNKENKVYLDPNLLFYNGERNRHFTYLGDNITTNGSWMLEQRGRRIC